MSKPSRTTTKTKSEETRARILDSALRLFRKQGFEQTTMREIAAEAEVALGAAYYYFESKNAIVMAFYDRAQQEMHSAQEQALTEHRDFTHRLRALLDAKLNYFQPNRKLLGALSTHIDPEHPLSPFSESTRPIRDKDILFFTRAFEQTNFRVPKDLQVYLPRVLWIYQMGLLLFWIYDRSTEQIRTKQLAEKSLLIIVSLIKFSNFPLMKPVRSLVVDLLRTIYGDNEK